MTPRPIVINETELTAEQVMELLYMSREIEQGTEAWFTERLGKPTASQIKDVLAKKKETREKYMYELLVERLTGNRMRFSSRYTDWGNKMEEAAAVVYEQVTGADVRTTGFHEHPELASGASPDRLVNDDGLVQIKCPNSSTHLKYLLGDAIPKEYFYQMHWELACSPGRQYNDFMSYDPAFDETGQAVFIKRMERDEEMISYMTEKVAAFLEEVNGLERKLRGGE